MFQVNVHGLNKLCDVQLQETVKELAKHIGEGKALSHNEAKVNECYLLVLDQKSVELPSKEVLEDLNAVILTSIEKDIDRFCQGELKTIRELRDRIIDQSRSDGISKLPHDALMEIQSNLSLGKNIRNQTVSKAWKNFPKEPIKAINERKLSIRKELGDKVSAKQALNWLLMNPSHKELEYADFSYFNDFDNECLGILTKNCPNLKYLSMLGSKISEDGLKHLVHVPNLLSLNIERCFYIGPDALKHLVHVPNLLSLNIENCLYIGPDALKHLVHVPNLQSLDFWGCKLLEPDALKHLVHTPNLQSLNFKGCKLEPDALKHLVHTPNLQSLYFGVSKKHLEPDALKHLVHVPNLQSLHAGSCYQFEPDALKHLVHVPKLKSLYVRHCTSLEPDTLKHLVHVANLQYLDVIDCNQLESDALKHLVHTPKLQSLTFGQHYFLAKDALKHLRYTPNLLSLDVRTVLEFDALKHLLHTPNLLTLNVAACSGLEPDALKHLVHTPNLQILHLNWCNPLKLEALPSKGRILVKKT